jgi:hypothetical protein
MVDVKVQKSNVKGQISEVKSQMVKGIDYNQEKSSSKTNIFTSYFSHFTFDFSRFTIVNIL